VAHPTGEAETFLYGQILQAFSQGIWVIGNGRTRYANRRMAEMMGCSVDELVTLSVLDIFEPDAVMMVRQRTERVRAGNRVHFNQKLRRADGSTFLAEVYTTPMFNQAGRYEASVAVVSDITARNEVATEARLRASLLDSITDAVTAATPEGEVVYINPAAERMFGCQAADVLGRDGRGLFSVPEAAEERARIHASLLSGSRYTGRLTVSRRDGSRFVANVKSSPVRDEQGTIVGLMAVPSDQPAPVQPDRELLARELQAETLALLGAEALQHTTGGRRDPARILTEAVSATRRLLQADRAVAFELVAGGEELRAHVAAPPVDEGIVLPTGSQSFAGYVALAGKVVVVDDMRLDRRFETEDALGAGPGAAAIGAPILGPGGTIGVLTATRSTPNRFVRFDEHFIQGMANVIGTTRRLTTTV
jgi:PAS domain S-box-containing protein